MEVGFGVGSNWEYLPADVDYTGIEPDEYMLERAIQNAHAEGLELELEAHDVQSLPYEDDSFDTVITTLTFCSVPDAHTGLAEINRVLKPGGELRFAEHVRSQSRLGVGLQRLLKPITRRAAGGCEWDRDTVSTIRSAGFVKVSFKRSQISILPVAYGSCSKDQP